MWFDYFTTAKTSDFPAAFYNQQGFGINVGGFFYSRPVDLKHTIFINLLRTATDCSYWVLATFVASHEQKEVDCQPDENS